MKIEKSIFKMLNRVVKSWIWQNQTYFLKQRRLGTKSKVKNILQSVTKKTKGTIVLDKGNNSFILQSRLCWSNFSINVSFWLRIRPRLLNLVDRQEHHLGRKNTWFCPTFCVNTLIFPFSLIFKYFPDFSKNFPYFP